MRRKWLIRLVLGVLGSLGLSVLGLYLDWQQTRSRGEERRNAVVRALDAEDPNWRVTDLAAAHNAALPPPDQNAADRAALAVTLLPKNFTEWHTKRQRANGWKPVALDGDDYSPELAALHTDCTRALEVAREIRGLPRGGSRIIFADPNPMDTRLKSIDDSRTVAGLLDLDALVLGHAGQADAAVQSVLAMVNCGRGIGDEPTLIPQLIRIRILDAVADSTARVMRLAKPSGELGGLQAAISEELVTPRLSVGARGDRAMYDRFLENLDAGALWFDHDAADFTSRHKGSLMGRLDAIPMRKYLPDQRATIIEVFNAFIAADKLSGKKRLAAYEQLPYPQENFETLLVNLVRPAIRETFVSESVHRAKMGCTIAAIAGERYRLNTGHWPPSLEAIPKGILPAVPADPYTGSPLLYKLTPVGAVVYCAGPDLVDNGGVKLTEAGDPGTDIGFRLLNPDQRRRPPLPKPAPDAGPPAPGQP